jgi:hypothetical protein
MWALVAVQLIVGWRYLGLCAALSIAELVIGVMLLNRPHPTDRANGPAMVLLWIVTFIIGLGYGLYVRDSVQASSSRLVDTYDAQPNDYDAQVLQQQAEQQRVNDYNRQVDEYNRQLEQQRQTDGYNQQLDRQRQIDEYNQQVQDQNFDRSLNGGFGP